MDFKFQSTDFGALVFGREVLKKEQNTTCELWVGQVVSPARKAVSESDLWEPALQKILSGMTRFGRVGIFYDRKNMAAQAFCKKLPNTKSAYKPKDKRAEKTLKFYTFETQVLHHMANEGYADTVEFRRLARKFLRHAKNAHCDTLFFMEAIFGEEKTRKILQHLAGTQSKVVVPSDFIALSTSSKLEKRKIVIHTGDTLEFTKTRAEQVLHTKLSSSDIQI